uniref:Uncharacterized protein n=1 Tax=Rhizophora mucronata TaxID=61149 RepID=A0A2P2QR83_RHIMU
MGALIRLCLSQELLCHGHIGKKFYLVWPLLWPTCIKNVKTRSFIGMLRLVILCWTRNSMPGWEILAWRGKLSMINPQMRR